MTQQVVFEQSSGAIMQWQDTDQFHYADPVAGLATLLVTDEQWAERESFLSVSGGALSTAAITLPEPTAAELLVAAQAVQVTSLNAACAKVVTAGFTSSALGAVYTYPSDQNDQANLAANVLSSMYPNLPADWTTPQLCADSTGVWAYRAHTVAQIQKAGSDVKNAILALLQRKGSLEIEVQAATTVAAVQAVVW